MRISVTLARSKVKIKVTELPKLRKFHFSRYISAVLAWNSKMTVDGDNMGPGVQHFPFCDDLIDWNSGVSVRTSTKSFLDFDLIWCSGRPRPDTSTSITSTQYKFKVKVTELVMLRKLHYSRFTSSATFVHSCEVRRN